MIKAAFFDMDGTLFYHKHGIIPEDSKAALRALREKGIKVILCTGRHPLELLKIPMQDMVFDGYILLNGQLCLDEKQEVFFDTAIDMEDIQQILPYFEERKIPLIFMEKNRIYLNVLNERVIEAQSAFATPIPEIGSYREGEKIYLVNAFGEDADINRVKEKMPHCEMTRWNPEAVDIVCGEVGKVKGIEQFLSRYGITKEEIIAFGDGENDMEMLQYAGIGVAMGNAAEKIQACANYVTQNVEAGGILHALQHFGIL